MIARLWHGVTRTERADEYLEILERTGLADYESVEGNRGACILRRRAGEQTHFLTLSFWESRAAIEAFAGPDIERAKYYPEDEAFLLEFEKAVEHYEVYPREFR